MGGGKDGKGFVTVVDANARNKIVYPGSFSDADFYSRQFGEIIENEIKQNKTYDTFAGFKGIFSDKISESVSSTRRARFTPEDIVFRPFGEITYCLIKNNSIQTPGVSKIQYIPRELNDELDRMVAEYNEEQARKIKEKELRENGGITEEQTMPPKEANTSITNSNNPSNKTSDSEFIDIGINDLDVINENNNNTTNQYQEFNSSNLDIGGIINSEFDDDSEDL